MQLRLLTATKRQQRPTKEHMGARRVGKHWSKYLIFLSISAILWLITSLQKEYETTLHLRVVYPNLGQYAPGDSLPSSLEVKIKTDGYTLMRYFTFRTQAPLELMFDVQRAQRECRLLISSAQLNQSLQARLDHLAPNARKTIVSITPSEIDIRLARLHAKSVPVVNRTHIEPSDGFLLNSILLEPNNVTVYGSKSQLAALQEVFTDTITIRQRESAPLLKEEIPLQPIEGIRFSTSRVQAKMQFIQFTEKHIEVPIRIENLPPDVSLTLLPSQATLRVAIPITLFDKVGPNDFVLSVDYNELQQEPRDASRESTLTVVLSQPPEWLIHYSIQPDKIQFIREAHEQ